MKPSLSFDEFAHYVTLIQALPNLGNAQLQELLTKELDVIEVLLYNSMCERPDRHAVLRIESPNGIAFLFQPQDVYDFVGELAKFRQQGLELPSKESAKQVVYVQSIILAHDAQKGVIPTPACLLAGRRLAALMGLRRREVFVVDPIERTAILVEGFPPGLMPQFDADTATGAESRFDSKVSSEASSKPPLYKIVRCEKCGAHVASELTIVGTPNGDVALVLIQCPMCNEHAFHISAEKQAALDWLSRQGNLPRNARKALKRGPLQ
jgi:hypothetical protein